MASPFEEIEKKTHQYSYRATSPCKNKNPNHFNLINLRVIGGNNMIINFKTYRISRDA
jgi:hypothetical protein